MSEYEKTHVRAREGELPLCGTYEINPAIAVPPGEATCRICYTEYVVCLRKLVANVNAAQAEDDGFVTVHPRVTSKS